MPIFCLEIAPESPVLELTWMPAVHFAGTGVYPANWPARQSLQSATLSLEVSLDHAVRYLPLGQDTQELGQDEPEYLPSGQVEHDADIQAEYLPPGQTAHDVEVEYLPPGHVEHDVADEAEYLASGQAEHIDSPVEAE
jgi:hypothetical protein